MKPIIGVPDAPADSRSVRVGVFHPWMNVAGSECTTMWVIQALLKQDYEVVLVCPQSPRLDLLNQAFGTEIEPGRLHVVSPPVRMGGRLMKRFPLLWIHRFNQFARQISPSLDVCISGYNLMDFSQPGIQLIGDFSFDPEFAATLGRSVKHRRSPAEVLKTYYRRGVRAMLPGSTLPQLDRRGDLIVANSEWTARIIEKQYGIRRPYVVYPPVYLDTDESPRERTDDKVPVFVCIGRISPEKRVERVISILKGVRERGHEVLLRIVGGIGEDPYGQMVRDLILENETWIDATGLLVGPPKVAALTSAEYGIQGREFEPFGISVAEMIKAGCIVFCPVSGGQFEIVGHESLGYASDDEAVDKIVAVLTNPRHQRALHAHLDDRIQRFETSIFVREIQDLVVRFLDKQDRPAAARRGKVGALARQR